MLLELHSVSKQYKLGTTIIKALDNVSVNVDTGEFVAVIGPSGSGKSTFLQIASILAQPTSGQIKIKGKDVSSYNEIEGARLRNREIGFIFQQFNLLPRTSALENVKLPMVYAGVPEDEQNIRATALLKQLGLADRLNNSPAQLSGGQQQRVAIARALVNNPSIIFADEPTGNLDSKSGETIKQILLDLHKEGKTIIMVTHEIDVANITNRILTFHDGVIVSDKKTKKTKVKKNA